MLITFTSKSSADVLMYETHAKPILDLLGKDTQRGIITAEETGNAIAQIESAIAMSKISPDAANPPSADDKDDEDEKDIHPSKQPVSFAARVFPLLDMLRAAQRDQQFVMWSV